MSTLTERAPDEICRKAGIPLLLASSIKAGLDIDWSDPKQKVMAIDIVERQVSSLQRWVEQHLDEVVSEPLRPYIEAMAQVRNQDLEPAGDGGVRIRQGVAPAHFTHRGHPDRVIVDTRSGSLDGAKRRWASSCL